MKSLGGLQSKTYILILLMVIFGPLGNVLLGKGMKSMGAVTTWNPAQFIHIGGILLTSGVIWMGIGSLIMSFVAYILVLSWADYSYVQPASSISYGIVALLGHVLLGEVLSPTRVAGVLIICLGVFIVGHTPPRTTEQN